MQEEGEQVPQKHNSYSDSYSYSYSYRYLLPLPRPIPIPIPPSHPPKTRGGERFSVSLGKTLNGVGPVQTSAERAAEALTLVHPSPSRQALTGLPGTSHDFLLGESIEGAGVAFMGKLQHYFECQPVRQGTLVEQVLSKPCSKTDANLRTTDEERVGANPFEVAGGRFEAELLRRFHGEAVA